MNLTMDVELSIGVSNSACDLVESIVGDQSMP
jgi:hypothetical protein